MKNTSEDPNFSPLAKLATKIRVIEDEEATAETSSAYDFWRAGSGRQKVPGIIKCSACGRISFAKWLNFQIPCTFLKGISPAGRKKCWLPMCPI